MPEDPRLADELEKMEYEPLNGAEKTLIVVSLALGLVLLVAFIALTRLWPGFQA